MMKFTTGQLRAINPYTEDTGDDGPHAATIALAHAAGTIDALVAALEVARSRIAGEWWEDHPDVQQADAALALARGEK